jgi:predicted kinase
VRFFEPNQDRTWIDTSPQPVLAAFVLFFSNKRLEGISFTGIEDLVKASQEAQTVLKECIRQFLDRNATEISDSLRSQVEEHIDSVASEHPVAQINKKVRVFKKSIMMVLVGLPGSGKSTLYEGLRDIFGDKLKRLCQDDIGKDACEREAHFGMEEGGHVILIDRTNINKHQRSTWVKIAQRYKCPCTAVVFDVTPDICIARASKRKSHNTLQTEQVPRVVQSLFKAFQPVMQSEGFDKIFVGAEEAQTLKTEVEEYIRAWDNGRDV